MTLALYKKQFSRERPLIQFELWYYGEASGPRKWTEQVQPYQPYIVFNRAGATVDCYYDERGIEWCKDEIFKIFQRDPEHVKDMARMYLAHAEKSRPLLENIPALPREKLIAFCEEVRETWAYFELMWWATEALEHRPEYAADHSELMEVRRGTEHDSSVNDKVIRASLARIFPDAAAYASVISFKEVLSGALPSEDELEERLHGYYYTDERLFSHTQRSEMETRYGIQLERPNIEALASGIKGQIAYKGKVSGRVRKIFSSKDIAAFQEGEILVAAATIPDFLAAMKKAAAIVSDEGGLITHAAIVARELKKPCLIGTRFAMEGLADGDMVEVDAEKGIVRKI